MATTNVFGSEIWEMTVRDLPAYGDPKREISPWDLSKVALDMIGAENKLEKARAYLDELKARFGDGVCTKVLLYNATGATMSFVLSHDWNGNVGESSYPAEIKNGQWGAFFHQKPAVAPTGSEGAVVYRLRSPDAAPEVDCMVSWSTPWLQLLYKNNCYAEIREPNHFNDVWGVVKDKMGNSGQQCEENSDLFVANVTITGDTTSECQATVRLIPLSPAFDLMND